MARFLYNGEDMSIKTYGVGSTSTVIVFNRIKPVEVVDDNDVKILRADQNLTEVSEVTEESDIE